MRLKFLILLLLLTEFSNSICAQQVIKSSLVQTEEVQRNILEKHFSDYKVYSLNTEEIHVTSKKANKEAFNIVVLFDNEFLWNLNLIARDLRAPSYQSVISSGSTYTIQERSPVTTFRGYANGNEHNKVRLTINEEEISGYIQNNHSLQFIEPLINFDSKANKQHYIIYQPEDVIAAENGSSTNCLFQEVEQQIMNFSEKSKDESRTTHCEQLDIATDADFEYFQNHGNNSNDFILGILNQVEGIYAETFNIYFNVVHQHIFTTSSPNYVATFVNDLAVEIEANWTTNPMLMNVDMDMVFLFTGKEITGIGVSGGPVPVAGYMLGDICWAPFPIAFSRDQLNEDAGLFRRYVTAAHEIAHGFQVQHTYDACVGVTIPGFGIMAQSLSDNMHFCFAQISIDQFNNYRAFIDSSSSLNWCLDIFDPCLATPVCPEELIIDFDLEVTAYDYVPNEIIFEASDRIIVSSENITSNETNFDFSFIAGSYVDLTTGFHRTDWSSGVVDVFIDDCGNNLPSSPPPVGKPSNERQSNHSESQLNSTNNVHIYPNPFSDIFQIEFSMPEAGEVQIDLYDVAGKNVLPILAKEVKTAGSHMISMDGSHLENGIYFCSLKLGEQRITHKLTLLK